MGEAIARWRRLGPDPRSDLDDGRRYPGRMSEAAQSGGPREPTTRMTGGSIATRPWCGTASPRWRPTPTTRRSIVERAEGRELIDVDGRRYLDAISSLWVTTLGHHVPELDAAVRAQLDQVAHTTLLGNGNVAADRAGRGARPSGPGRRPALPVRVRRCRRRRAGAQDRVPVLDEPGRRRPDAATWRSGGAYHGDTIGAISLGAGGFGTDVFDPLRFSVPSRSRLRRSRLGRAGGRP